MSTDLEILETLALRDGQWQNWSLHWERLQMTARHFCYPLMQMALEQGMSSLLQKHATGEWRVRLALSASGSVQFTVAKLFQSLEPVRLALAKQPLSNAVVYSDAVRFKTSVREHYEAFAPRSETVFDTVLFNEDGFLTECTRGNIAVQLGGCWVTPPLSCGLLPGVGRALALSQGRLRERVVTVEEAQQATGWAFINSLRGWLNAHLMD